MAEGDADARIRTMGAVTQRSCELQRHYSDLLSRLPIQCDDEDLVSTNGELTEVLLDRATVPATPAEMTTDAIRLQRGCRDWMGWRVDQFWLTLDKAACRALGLLILGVVLHPEPEEVEVHLTDPESDIKVLRVEYFHQGPGELGYVTVPGFLNYHPQQPSGPSPLGGTPVHALPVLRLDQSDPEERSVVGFGSDVGSVNLAALLLDLGLADNPYNEIELLGEPGGEGRGVGVASAELSIRLPGERTNFYGPPAYLPTPLWVPPWQVPH